MLEYKGYHAAITYDQEDDILVGCIFGIQDSINFHGSSVPEITEMFHKSVDNYLQYCKDIGKNPDREYKGSLNIRLTPTRHRALALYAATHHMTLNQVVNDAIEQYCVTG